MLLTSKASRFLPAVAVAEIVLVSALLVLPAASATYSFTFAPTKGGNYLSYTIRSLTFPVSVAFAVNDTSPGTTDFWQFGDGANATGIEVTHVYTEPCLYVVSEVTTALNGSTTKGGIDLGIFASGSTYQAMAACPPEGTAGFTPVEVTGGFFTAGQQIEVRLNGTGIGNVTVGSGGDWQLNVTSILPPEPNGTEYQFTTSPPTATAEFTTLEGIEASPKSGAPGDTVIVEGRSYPSDSNVSVSLANVTLGPAQTSLNGSFTGVFSVPNSAPISSSGTYQYITGPPILGTHADFDSAGSSTGPVVVSSSLWLWIILIVLVALACILIWLLGRRRRNTSRGRTVPEPRIHRALQPRSRLGSPARPVRSLGPAS